MAEKHNLWRRKELLVAFALYCQIPFGKMHKSNPEVIYLAKLIDRTPSSVAMKLVNFASLDSAITDTGRSGLGNASAADRAMWSEFHNDWEQLALESKQVLSELAKGEKSVTAVDDEDGMESTVDYEGATKAVVTEVRIKQSFFRRAVLSSYKQRCCMTNISESRLLVASHIVPWKSDAKNRLNPRNGLCLSALHDKAFDRGLITITDEFRVQVSPALYTFASEPFITNTLLSLNGKLIMLPEKFSPDVAFLKRHREEIFVGCANG